MTDEGKYPYAQLEPTASTIGSCPTSAIIQVGRSGTENSSHYRPIRLPHHWSQISETP